MGHLLDTQIDYTKNWPPQYPTLAFVKNYMRVDYSSDDSMISILIQAAVEKAEAYCGRTFAKRTYNSYYDLIERTFYLPNAPIATVNTAQLVYLNQVSNLTINQDFFVQGFQDKFLVLTVTTYNLPPGYSTNDDLWRFNLQINYDVGYDLSYLDSTGASKVPASLLLAICKIVSADYNLRDNVIPTSRQGTIGFIEIPNDAKSLLNAYRVIPV